MFQMIYIYFTIIVVFVGLKNFNCEQLDFSSVPTTVKTYKTSAVLLPCYLNTKNNDGAQGIRVKWYKDNNLWADSGQQDFLPPLRFKLWGNGSLQVVDIQPDDTGKYTCEIIRSEPWAPVRQTHAIEVLQPPVILPQPPSRYLEVKLGDEVEMGCITGGVPAPIVSWTHNGEPLQLINNRNILKFNVSERHFAGIYECIAMNGVGDSVRDKIELKVLYPPEISTSKTWIHSAPDLKVQLECKVNAVPKPTVSWFKGEKLLKRTDKRIIQFLDGNKHILLIKKIIKSDFGFYTCKVSNEIGVRTIEYQLSESFVGVPNPVVFKTAESENDKDSYTFIWEVESYTPIIEYNLRFRPLKPNSASHKTTNEWTVLTIPTEHRSNSHVYSKKYTLRGLKERVIYEIQVLSRNRYGWSKPSAVLRFSINGEEVTEEVITSVITEPENNIDNVTPLEITSGGINLSLNSWLYIIISLNVIFK
ncbi:neogenin isoform X1 [Onthophagus taurus]|uniref:neogenin isoform X1 n=1 Tax=Onthophagus taurus TaxID=166361 RepID=UPI0039BE7E99